MDPSESSKNKKEDKSSSSQPDPELSYLSYLNAFDPEDFFLLDELDSARLLLDSSPPKRSFENEGDIISEDPCNTEKLNLSSEEPTIVHQEKQAYVDEQGDIQYVEWPSPELREANAFVEALLETQPCHDSHGQAIEKRCLQYEEALSNALGSDNTPLAAHFSEEPVSSPPRFSENSPTTGSNSLIHINSLINATPPPPVRSATTDKGLEISKRKSTKLRLVFSQNIYGQSTAQITRLDPSEHTMNESHEINPSVAADIVTSESPTPPSMTEPFPSSSCPANVHDNTTISPTDGGTGNFEEFNQQGSRKTKIRRSTNDPDADDSKICTCKRSACTKRYCDCFAAELYCTESCTCQGCLNRPEYKEFLLDIRNKMTERDPFAFASKIVQEENATDINLPNNTEDGNMKTPSSARHRKGCHCLKSKCLKNYCECFEIKVWCSSACRCVGCENSYGRKEEEGALRKGKDSDGVEKPSDSLGAAELDENDVQGFSPLTPSLQCSDMNESATNVSPVTPASMSGASCDRARTPQGSSPMASRTPLLGRLEEATRNVQRLESGGLIRGRKFVWKANVSSFPPLTPCIDSKAKSKGKGGGDDSGDGAMEPGKGLK